MLFLRVFESVCRVLQDLFVLDFEASSELPRYFIACFVAISYVKFVYSPFLLRVL